MIEEPFNPEIEFKKFHESNRENVNFEFSQRRPSEFVLKEFAEKKCLTLLISGNR